MVLLDGAGEAALTFRTLAAELSTGPGALYWHVKDKDALLAACADSVVAQVMSEVVRESEPRAAIRALAAGIFDAMDAHPWVGAQLHRSPEQSAMLDLFEGVGAQLQALGIPERAQFDAAATLVSFTLGVAGQNAANARRVPQGTDRAAYLAAVVAHWTGNDPAQYPFVHGIASQLREHDDRAQFLAGIEMILSGALQQAVAG